MMYYNNENGLKLQNLTLPKKEGLKKLYVNLHVTYSNLYATLL